MREVHMIEADIEAFLRPRPCSAARMDRSCALRWLDDSCRGFDGPGSSPGSPSCRCGDRPRGVGVAFRRTSHDDLLVRGAVRRLFSFGLRLHTFEAVMAPRPLSIFALLSGTQR